ncbi:hypothetical protein LF65_02667 [Clostridium beijerinckii]|uniref:Metallo-beta-lactamase domain-containing protein n=1 Tax=Clostridium beijerinckii TaxID=1520 RepID=A0A0B5QE50_CLOBE|nr:MBL fold metallo-hydrolase [Clostridium beijerinckii]AJG99240.1 hypothetical protein LF65_02667 [Clostridium beijerinckii]
MICTWPTNYKLKLESKLIYHAIGNGLFSSGKILIKNLGSNENIKEFNYIYDCGTNNSKEILEKRIDEYNKSNKKNLDLLTISHFDKDHINGLEKLLNGRRVKRIILPYLDPRQRFTLALKYFSHVKKISYMIFDPTSFFENYADEIIYVTDTKYDSKQTQVFNDNDNSIRIIGEEIDKSLLAEDLVTMPSKVRVFSKLEMKYNDLVKFKFYNRSIEDYELTDFYFKVDAVLKKFSLKLDKKIFYNKMAMEEIKKIYKALPYGINNSSICMSVISCEEVGNLKNTNIKCIKSKLLGINCHSKACIQRFGYMFTGDLRLKDVGKYKIFNDFVEYYSNERDFITIFTLPHHGSKYNWNKDILNKFENADMIITARGNAIHPSSEVLRDLSLSSRHNTTVNHISNKEISNEVLYYSVPSSK